MTINGLDDLEEHLVINCFGGALRDMQQLVRARNDKWWRDLHTNEPIARNDGELFMLMVSEIGEAMEGHRKKLMDDKLPHRSMVEVEMADLIIRVLDYAGGRGLDLAGAIAEKLEFNRTRHDHTHEGRKEQGGKAY